MWRQDNVIQWVFEKMFDQLTYDGKELNHTPFDQIKLKTFDNVKIHQYINQLTKRGLDRIIEYLHSPLFQRKFLLSKIKNKINVALLLHDLSWFDHLLNCGYQFNTDTANILVLNHTPDLVERIVQHFPHFPITPDLLHSAAEFRREEMYFYLRKKLSVNIGTYHRAVLGGSLEIIRDVSQDICLSSQILGTAFQTNRTEVILYLIEESLNQKVPISPNLAAYPLMNANRELVNYLDDNRLINWHMELYYSALLAGSKEMISLVEEKVPNIHHQHQLDTSRTKKGQSSLLLQDMIYQRNGKKFFSHVVNYAIQSGSLEMVKYVIERGYGWSLSNILTAIKQGTVAILDYLTNLYQKPLPSYFIYYFSVSSYIPDKMAKAKLLLDKNLLVLTDAGRSFHDFQKETAHWEMIQQNVKLSEGMDDIDYLMKYQLFFPATKDQQKLVTKARILLEYQDDRKLREFFSQTYCQKEKEILVDSLFLFGDIKQIACYHPFLDYLPSMPIVMEIFCYCQIPKICYLIQKGFFTTEVVNCLAPLVAMLSDDSLNLVLRKIPFPKPELKYVLLSGQVEQWIDKYYDDEITDMITLKNLLLLDDPELVKKCRISPRLLDQAIILAEEHDLLEVSQLLRSHHDRISRPIGVPNEASSKGTTD